MTTSNLPLVKDVTDALSSVDERVFNPSLMLDKYVQHKGKDGENKNAARDSLRKVSEALPPVDSKGFSLGVMQARSLLSQVLVQHGSRAKVVVALLEGRLAINLADGLIENAGILLDRLTGVPFIPGSAVKGVTRAVALDDLKSVAKDDTAKRASLFSAFQAIFGSSKADFDKDGDLHEFECCLADAPEARDKNIKGGVSFLPAYPIGHAPLAVDITNVHYPEYYKKGEQDKLKIEKPEPNPFPTVEKGAKFAFCFVANKGLALSHLAKAEEWLKVALERHGIGAKSAAGYGWFSIDVQDTNALWEQIKEDRQRAEDQARIERERIEKICAEEARQKAEAEALARMTPENRRQKELLNLSDEEFVNLAKKLADSDELTQRSFLKLLEHEKRDRWKSWKKKKPETGKSIRAVADKLKIQLP